MPVKVTNLFFDPTGSGVITLTGGAASWSTGTGTALVGAEYGAMVFGLIANSSSGSFGSSAFMRFEAQFIGESNGWFPFGRIRGSNTASVTVYGAFEVPYGVSEIRAVAKRGSGTAVFYGVYCYNDTK